ncbi:MAG TPA: RdgB/HAM1 family non-canonical purine NTP pyrophosphatase [Candidatus Sulfopaludibacter sp.]|nr:RdgB/HAM1 family non-canonical purine NTP pyrophosphatase [Candidatus Sulfopaludibacter sp.]
MIRLLCATGNRGKLREFQTIADAFPGPRVSIELLPEFQSIVPCEEHGATFAENALIKALHYGAHTALPLFADDSGLEVDALGGAPGVRSARYSGPGATDASNNRLLLDNLRGARDRAARFVCRIALVQGGRTLGIYTGSVEGVILEAPRGAGGFGYDPLFYYPPFGCTFGEAGEEQKSGVSHRGQALRKMLEALGEK